MLRNKIPYVILGVIIIVTITPYSYYTLSLDSSWGPHLPQPPLDSNTWLLYTLINLAPDALSGLLQKLILLTTFVLAGLGAHKLVQNTKTLNPYKYAPYFAGFLYIFNPFVYTRLITGQWLVLIGYALLPWFIAALWKFMNDPKLKTAWPAAAWLAAIGFTSIHTLGFAALIAIVLFALTFKTQLKKKLAWGSAIIGVWLLLNAVWLIPLLNGTSNNAQSIDSFGTSQLDAFATTGTIADSPALSAILLTGFWADGQGRYSLPSDFGVLWYVAAVLILVLVGFGITKVIQNKDRLGGAIAVAGFIGLILAIGVSWNVTAPLTYFLHQYLPFYAGYREPHKWLALLVVAYAYLGAMGISWLAQNAKTKKYSTYIFGVAIILPILFTPNLAWGAAGQLKSVQYPDGWKQAATALQDAPADTNILVLPWHMYLHVDFADRVVANPTRYYFTQNMIVGDNPELKGVPVGNKDAIHRYVNNIMLPQRKTITDAGVQLEALDIQYVMLLKEADYDQYGWVQKQKGLTQSFDNESMTIYTVGAK